MTPQQYHAGFVGIVVLCSLIIFHSMWVILSGRMMEYAVIRPVLNLILASGALWFLFAKFHW